MCVLAERYSVYMNGLSRILVSGMSGFMPCFHRRSQSADVTQRYVEEKNLPDSGKERFKRRFDILNAVMHHPGGKDRKRFIDLIDLQSAPGCQAVPSR